MLFDWKRYNKGMNKVDKVDAHKVLFLLQRFKRR